MKKEIIPLIVAVLLAIAPLTLAFVDQYSEPQDSNIAQLAQAKIANSLFLVFLIIAVLIILIVYIMLTLKQKNKPKEKKKQPKKISKKKKSSKKR